MYPMFYMGRDHILTIDRYSYFSLINSMGCRGAAPLSISSSNHNVLQPEMRSNWKSHDLWTSSPLDDAFVGKQRWWSPPHYRGYTWFCRTTLKEVPWTSNWLLLRFFQNGIIKYKIHLEYLFECVQDCHPTFPGCGWNLIALTAPLFSIFQMTGDSL